jgi:nitroimidazol reductase NimA-like FMN-containing flavoprotein (pyridoxamine 5'-phosphate oxidase superfamily)
MKTVRMTENQAIGSRSNHAAFSSVRMLDEDECWRLIAESSLGRFAVKVHDGVDVFPINYLAHDHELFFRSAPGSKLIDLTLEPKVAFEIDGEHARHAWSVVVHGTARRLASDQDIDDSGIQSLKTWHPSEKYNYVRISPESVSGRSFAKS